jgi:hypothetical protein
MTFSQNVLWERARERGLGCGALSYKAPERSEWERGAAPLSNLLPRLKPAGVKEREPAGEVEMIILVIPAKAGIQKTTG